MPVGSGLHGVCGCIGERITEQGERREMKTILNLTVSNRRAWTGGDVPPAGFRRRCADYRALVSAMFQEQVRDCLGLDFWACAGTSALERARIFWNRAVLDAWRTYTESRKYPTQLGIAYRLEYGRKWKCGESPAKTKLGKVAIRIGEGCEDGEAIIRREFPQANAFRMYDETGELFYCGSL